MKNKDTYLQLRVSSGDKRRIQELASKAGLSVAAYVLLVINIHANNGITFESQKGGTVKDGE